MNEPKVIGLAEVDLQVPDLTVAESFYGAFGLTAEQRGSALGLRSLGRSADEIVVLPGAKQKRMHHISFIIRPGDDDAFDRKLRKAGLQTQVCARRSAACRSMVSGPLGHVDQSQPRGVAVSGEVGEKGRRRG